MIKPIKTIFFFIIVGGLLALSMLLLPNEKIDVLGFNIHMPSFEEMITKDSISYADISDITKNINNIDSLIDITTIVDVSKIDSLAIDYTLADSTLITLQKEIRTDTAKANAIALAQNIYRIEFPKADNSNLMKFFAKLPNARNKNIKIMHYGDSQIEGDRITSYIRNKLQRKYGGFGPGLLPALQPYESYFSIDQTNEGNWKRYAIFGKRDTIVKHNNYGPLAAFSRFAPVNNDSIIPDSVQYTASVIFKESKLAYSLVRSFNKIRLMYGNAKKPVNVKFYVDELLVKEAIVKTNTSYSVFEFTLEAKTKNLRIDFSGADSPDIYGIDLLSKTGITVDNIGMRGSSGTIFRKMNYSHLKQSYDDMAVDLFILQFGGNVMPYIKDSIQAVNYGNWFKSQLKTIKRMRPDASFIVIGPSDMSYKDGDMFVTYPFLELVRDELKKASLAAGYGYWDMYEAMGGKNSMPSWVNAEPALAGADYIHFTPKGAKLIANMFYNALMVEGVK